MLPYVHLFGLRLPAYGLSMIFGLIVAMFLLRFQARQFGVSYYRLGILTLYTCLAGIIAANLAHRAINFRTMTTAQIFDFANGHMFYGFFFSALLTVFIVTRVYKMPFVETLNICAPAWASAQVFGRVGCFLAGCCYGKPCSLPWAVTYTDPLSAAPLGIPLHPTQLYEAAAMALVVVALFVLQDNKRIQPHIVFIYAFAYAVVRPVVDFFRDNTTTSLYGDFSISQGISLLVILLLGSRFAVLIWRPRPARLPSD
jgi:phosphatidylglycerol:prolipoprotein diacylglycerol transferase